MQRLMLWKLAAFACLFTPAQASTIKFQVTGTGTLGANSFTNALFTLTSDYNSANWVITGGTNGTVVNNFATIDIPGGTYTFTGPSSTWVDLTNQQAGLSLQVQGSPGTFADAIFTFSIAGVSGWNWQSSFGPVSTIGLLPFATNFDTSGGTLTLVPGKDPDSVSFQVFGVPEPGSFALLGLGVALLARMRRSASAAH